MFPLSQLVGYQTTREEIWDPYHQVYKLRRLPGPPTCRLEQVCKLTRDVVSSLKNCLWQRGGKQPRGHEEPEPTDSPLSQSRFPQKMRWDGSCCCIRGKNREIEPVYHQKQGTLTCPFSQPQPKEEKILGAEQEAQQGLTRGQPNPFSHTLPSSVGSRGIGRPEG